ncbi:hypothetical protein J2Z44_004025 [Clostridium punense]|uniref:Uncharacterized protein n=1 Tax=Clostridium punense TaxID=1054297 RepID=A0ABS4K8S1_9CLOT|nr:MULTISPECIES: hypothetical protein [Clostridium]EQB89992.1 hypothetical protein M918_02295 [Clostridium sp. BL8]MBP2024170.1 hypothetical protein [Clostridium punense]
MYATIPYSIEIGEWCEFYRSAVLDSSELLEKLKQHPNPELKKIKEQLKHVYLGIDNGIEYKELDIICKSFTLKLESEEFVVCDDFQWL